jgi:hypothetical protein
LALLYFHPVMMKKFKSLKSTFFKGWNWNEKYNIKKALFGWKCKPGKLQATSRLLFIPTIFWFCDVFIYNIVAVYFVFLNNI